MGHRMLRLAAVVGVLATGVGAPRAQSTERGVFGLSVEIAGDGVFNPVIARARVTSVRPGFPAARAGLRVGDELLEVDGRRVPGATARDLAPLARGKRVGESVAVRVQRGSEALSFVLVAVPRSETVAP